MFYKQRTGDALLTYENEVIMTNMSQALERRLPYVVPQNNVSVSLATFRQALGHADRSHAAVVLTWW